MILTDGDRFGTSQYRVYNKCESNHRVTTRTALQRRCCRTALGKYLTVPGIGQLVLTNGNGFITADIRIHDQCERNYRITTGAALQGNR